MSPPQNGLSKLWSPLFFSSKAFFLFLTIRGKRDKVGTKSQKCSKFLLVEHREGHCDKDMGQSDTRWGWKGKQRPAFHVVLMDHCQEFGFYFMCKKKSMKSYQIFKCPIYIFKNYCGFCIKIFSTHKMSSMITNHWQMIALTFLLPIYFKEHRRCSIKT